MNRLTSLARLCIFTGSATLAVLILVGCSTISSIVNSVGNGGNGTSTMSASGGNLQFAPISTAFPTALQVTLKDSSGNAVSNATVTFAALVSGASGVFMGGGNTVTATTDSTGVATSPAFTANSTSGSYSIVASASGGTETASFNLTNTDVTGNWSYAFVFSDGSTSSGTLALTEQGSNVTGTIYDPGTQVGTITGTAGPNGVLTSTWNFQSLTTSGTSCQSVTILTTSIQCPVSIPCFGAMPPGYGGPLTGVSTVSNLTTGNTCSVSPHGGVSLILNPSASPGMNLTGSWLTTGGSLATIAQSGQNLTGIAYAPDGTIDSVTGTISGSSINVISVSPNGCTATIVATEASDGSSFTGTDTETGSSCNQTGSGSISATRI
jgi:hypothetical protein